MSKSVPISFECGDHTLVGIIDIPEYASRRAVLVVVGGPQYRVGSHRLFTLLCRGLADAGILAMRFDHRGIGDSTGSSTFEQISPDIRAAIDTLIRLHPSVTEIVLWGLCDGASAAMMYASSDPRVKGLVLLNPWARSERTLAKSYFRGYYINRLLSRDFWSGLFSGNVDVRQALVSVVGNAKQALSKPDEETEENGTDAPTTNEPKFQVRMMNGLERFSGNVLFILSGDDITADEFLTFVNSRRAYRKLMRRRRAERRALQAADHTFSTREWRDQVITWSRTWVTSW